MANLFYWKVHAVFDVLGIHNWMVLEESEVETKRE